MNRRTTVIAGVGAFVLLLLYVTLQSTSTPLDRSPEDRDLAQRACQAAVRGQQPDARFPFAADFEELGDGKIHLSGSVDGGPADRPVRRNYDCFLRPGPTGGYVADSVRVWQSH